LDDTGLSVEAQYNPSELEISKNIPWQKHGKANANGLQVEFTGAEGRSMSLVLLFDGYETKGQAGKLTVTESVKLLQQMASVRKPTSSKDDERRPHHCVVAWGPLMGGSDNRFKCVIEQISTKYTMFQADGTPLRATVTLKLKEADRAHMAAALAATPTPAPGSSGGTSGAPAGGTSGAPGGGTPA
jgi:hypothetical protein